MIFLNKKTLYLFSGFLMVFLFFIFANFALAQACPQEKPELGLDCTPDYYCGGQCMTLSEIQSKESSCTGGRFLDCDTCNCQCPSGQIWCAPNCQAANYGNCEALKREVANMCTGECGDCQPGRYDPDGNPATKEYCPALGEQEFVEKGGHIDPEGGATVRSEADISDPIIHYNQLGTGDFMKFFGPSGTIFYMNNEGNIGIENPVLDGGNLLWSNIAAGDTGNFILFQKDGLEVFKIESTGTVHTPQLCLDGVCKTTWPGEVPGVSGDWTGVENRPADKDHIFPDVSGDYGDATPGEEGGLRITDEGDLYLDGDLDVGGSLTLGGDTITNWTDIGGAGKWLDGVEAGDIYYDEGNVGISTDSPDDLLDISDSIRFGETYSARIPSLTTSYGDIGALSFMGGGGGMSPHILFNSYYDGAIHRYTSPGSAYAISDEDDLIIYYAADGATGEPAPFSDGITLQNDGNVGIGTIDPNRLLHLKTDSGTNAELDIQTANLNHWAIYHDEGTEELRFWNGDNNVVFSKNGDLSVRGCFGPKFVGLTSSAYNGNRNGYRNADTACSSQFGTGAHICTSDEIVNTLRCTSGNLVNPDPGLDLRAWIIEGAPGYTAKSNDCAGWSDNSSSAWGAIWNFNKGAAGQGAGFLTFCNEVIPFACCK